MLMAEGSREKQSSTKVAKRNRRVWIFVVDSDNKQDLSDLDHLMESSGRRTRTHGKATWSSFTATLFGSRPCFHCSDGPEEGSA